MQENITTNFVMKQLQKIWATNDVINKQKQK